MEARSVDSQVIEKVIEILDIRENAAIEISRISVNDFFTDCYFFRCKIGEGCVI